MIVRPLYDKPVRRIISPKSSRLPSRCRANQSCPDVGWAENNDTAINVDTMSQAFSFSHHQFIDRLADWASVTHTLAGSSISLSAPHCIAHAYIEPVAGPTRVGGERAATPSSPIEPLCTSKHFICSAKLLINKFVYQEND